MKIAVIVPVRNKADVLARCLESIRVACDAYPEASVVLVDNGSTDASLEIERSFTPRFELILSKATRVGAVRNEGAAVAGDVDVLAFIDCDCEVPPQFFVDVANTLNDQGVSAVGCEVVSPANGHWSELVWDRLHRPGGDGPRHYINSACFCITREWFERIRGFDADKVSSEDVDICRRLTAAGGTMWQSERLAIIHHGNPKTISGLYRRIRWHGEGVWESGKGVQWSVTTTATLLHPLVIVLGLSVSAWVASRDTPARLVVAVAIALLSLVAVPAAFVLARGVQHWRRVPLMGGIALMFITFAARIAGLYRARRAS